MTAPADSTDYRRCGWMADPDTRDGHTCGMRGFVAVTVEVAEPDRPHERRRMLLFLCAKHGGWVRLA